MNLANKITILRVLLIPIFLFVLQSSFFGTNARIIATIIFIVASLTDALDGYIARSRNLVTNFGKFMDPLADKLLVAAALICLVETRDLSALVVIIILSREFVITGFRTIAADNKIVMAASIWGKIKTVFQMSMIVFVLSDFGKTNETFKLIETILIILSVIFTILSAVDYIYKNINVLKDR